MKSLYNLLKIILKKVLPLGILNLIKKNHYLNTVSDFKIENEPDLVLALKFINRDENIIDIGANIGIYTKFLSEKVGKNGHIYSIEPIPTTFSFLNFNIEKLSLSNVDSFNYAISNDDKTRNMIIPSVTAGENYFRARITEKPDESISGTSYSVKSIKLDKLLDSKTNYSFIKIDVEGHEESVILGAQEVIAASLPILLIEIEGELNDESKSSGRVRANLEKLGYEVFFNQNQKLKKWQLGDLSINYFFIHPSNIQKLRDLELIVTE